MTHGDTIEQGYEHVTREPVLEAICIVTKIISDPVAMVQVFDNMGCLLHESIKVTDVIEMIHIVRGRKFLLAVQDSDNMNKACTQCLPSPNPVEAMQILLLNEKYSKFTKHTDRQVYFFVCKMLHEIGNMLTPDLLLKFPDYVAHTPFTTLTKNSANVIADCGAAVEEIAYGGRITAAEKSSQPYKHPLSVTVRKFPSLPLGPGNFLKYKLEEAHITTKMSELRSYLSDTAVVFPGLKIPAESMSTLLECNFAETEEKARARMMYLLRKRKRSTSSSSRREEAEEEDDDEEDPEFEEMVENGIAFSAEQVKRIAMGYRF